MSKIDKIRTLINEGVLLTEVDLSGCNLIELPEWLDPLADSLELLNLGGNHLSDLPSDFNKFRKLRILFFAQNSFQHIPVVLGSMESLYMISFKSNKLEKIAPEALPISIGWLILTDNRLTSLPSKLGLLPLRKLMLSGNQLTDLPEELQNCRDLELLRISCNQLTELPNWLLQMPSLSWLAFSGNLFNENVASTVCQCDGREFFLIHKNTFIQIYFCLLFQSAELPEISSSCVELKEKLGEGASGEVYSGIWHQESSGQSCLHCHDDASISNTEKICQSVAIKFFRSGKTSDGLPEDEMKVQQ